MKTIRLLVLAAILCSSCSGCIFRRWTDVADIMPIIKDDPRPAIDWTEIQTAWKEGKLTDREKELIKRAFRISNYAEIRDARIEAYNEYARSRNEEADKQGKALR